jgi:hypothetical protein
MGSKMLKMMCNLGFDTLLSVVLAILICVPVHAQVAGATLSGTVTDPSGGAVPNAKVSIKNMATGVVRDLTTDQAGFYSAPNLLPGPYEVTVSATGFSTYAQTGVTLAVAAEQLLNVSLRVGQITQKVEVTGAAPAVQLSTSTIGAEVNELTMRELPLNGRDWAQLAVLQPGVSLIETQAAASSTLARGNRGFGNQLTVMGHRPQENNYRMDGISVNDYSNAAPGSTLGVNLGVDAVQEFSVLTSDYSAEYGRTSGGVINAVLRSGTNQFHGGAYWFLRDEDFDARNFFDKNIPPFHRNQFGVSGGGPIKKGKTFIYADYEGIRQDLSSTFRDTVPTSDTRNGIIHNPDGTTTTVTVDPKVAPYLAFWPLPNAGVIPPGQTGFYVTSGVQRGKEDYVSTKVDQKLSAKDTLSGSWFYDNTPLTVPDALVDSLNQSLTRRVMVGLEETHIFSAVLVNTARVGLNRTVGLVNDPLSAINPLAKDLSLGTIPGRPAPILIVPGLTTMQAALGAQSIFHHHSNSIQFYDDAFLVKGTQSLKFGFAFERLQSNPQEFLFSNGRFQFPSLIGFLTNTPTFYQGLNPQVQNEEGVRLSILAGYIQDDWRARSNLTLNLGVRYEMETLPREVHNMFREIVNFYGGVPVPVNTAWQTNPTTKNFEPRVGFSWDPFKDGKTAVRGGFGIFDILPLPYTFDTNNSGSWPFIVQNSLSVAGLPAGTVFPTGVLALIPFNVNNPNFTTIRTRYVEQNPHRSYAMNWNLNVQRELGWNTSIMVGYVGSRSVHLPISTDDSQGVRGQLTSAGYLWPLPIGSGTKMNPNTSQMVSTMWDSGASYNGLQMQVTKRVSHGLQTQGSYTWSRCIDDASDGGISDFFTNSVDSLLFYIKPDRHGNCDFDHRQAFLLNYVYDFPAPKFGGTAARTALGGWELGGIVTLGTGSPFTPLIGGDPVGSKSANPAFYPDRLSTPGCANPINPGNVNNYLKLNCFSVPLAPASFAAQCSPGTPNGSGMVTCLNLFGNAGRNQVYGPGLADWDFSLIKNTYVRRISEAFNVQLRFEFFNILNHANFQAPIDNETLFNQSGAPVPGAGAIDTTTTTSRQIQFALKLIW